MEQERDTQHVTGSDIICLEGNGARPSHKGDGYSIGGVMYTLKSRDYKGVMIVVVSENDRRTDGEQPSRELLRTGRLQQHVGYGEK